MTKRDLGSRFDELQQALELHRDFLLDGETDAEPFLLAHEPIRHLLAPLIADGVDDPETASDPGTLRTLGGYQLIREIGRGAMGAVFEARQTALGRRVAVKVLPPQFVHHPTALERFKREARVVAQLDHPGIARIHDAEEHDGVHFFAMDFVEGASLDLVLRPLKGRRVAELTAADLRQALLQHRNTSRTPGPEDSDLGIRIDWQASYLDAVTAIGIQLAEALHHAHLRGVIHRDVKPSNVMLQDSGRIVLTDFGLAQDLNSVGLTATGDPLGTPSYASPEQLSMHQIPLDHRADVFSLGVTLYELTTLHRPFEADDVFEVKQQILTKEPKRPQKHHPETPRDLSSILMRAIEKDADRRYASMEEFAADLRRFRAGQPVVARPISSTTRAWRWCRRNPVVTTAIALQSLAVAGLFIAFLYVGEASAAATTKFRAADASRVSSQFDSLLSLGEQAPFQATTQLEIAWVNQQRCKRLGVPPFSPNSKLFRALDRTRVARQWVPHPPGEPIPDGDLTGAAGEATPLTSDLAFAVLGSTTGPIAVARLTENYDEKHPSGFPGVRLHGHEGGSFATISEDGELVLSAGEDQTVRLWDGRTGRQLDIRPSAHPATAVLLSPTARHGLSIHSDGTFWLYDTGSRTLRARPLGKGRLHEGDQLAGRFSPDGKHLVTATKADHPGETHFVHRTAWRLWKLDPLEELPLDQRVRSSAVQSITWQPDGQRFVLAIETAAHIIPVDPLVPVEIADFDSTLHWAGVSDRVPDRIVALCGGASPWIRTHDLRSGKTEQFSRIRGVLPFAAISPSGEDLAVATRGHKITLFDLGPGDRTQDTKLDSVAHFPTLQPATHLRWNRTGTRIASASPRSVQSFYFARDFMQTLAHPNRVNSLAGAFHPTDDNRCMTTADDGGVRLWDLRDPRHPTHELAPLPPPANPHRTWTSPVVAAFSPDGQRIATGSETGRITVWDLEGQRLWDNAEAHPAAILVLAFIHDGAQFVTISVDGTGIVWDVKSQRPLRGLALPRQAGKRSPEDVPWGTDALSATVQPSPPRAAVVTTADPGQRTLTILDLDTGTANWSRTWTLTERPPEAGPAVTATFAADGSVWVAERGSSARRFHPVEARPIGGPKPALFDRVLALDEGRTLGAETKTGRLVVMDASEREAWSTGSGLVSLAVPVRPVVDLALQPPGREVDGGRYLAVTWGTNEVLIFDLRRLRLHARLVHDSDRSRAGLVAKVTSCRFDGSGQRIITTCSRLGARVWPLHADREIQSKRLLPTRQPAGWIEGLFEELRSMTPAPAPK